MSVRIKQHLEQSEINPDTLRLQQKLQEHILRRLEEGLSHHSKVFGISTKVFWWSFLVVYVPLTIFISAFLIWGIYMLFRDLEKLKYALSFLTPQGTGITFAVLCAFPLAVLISLSKHNRIDSGKEDTSKLSDYIPTSGIFKDL